MLSQQRQKNRERVHFTNQRSPCGDGRLKNSAVKQTEGLRRHSLEYGEFLAQEPVWVARSFPPFYTRVFREIPTCLIFYHVAIFGIWN